METSMKSSGTPTGTPAECLTGLDLASGWHVVSLVKRPPECTGGFFSVGYEVRNKDGRRGYLKAIDFTKAHESEDWTRAIEPLILAYNFERDLLAKCRDHRLRRVVMPIDDGAIQVPGQLGPLGKVSYIIFERADGDIRSAASWSKDFDLAWSLRSLHQTAVGLRQLHGVGIAHQDLKPSNVLVFPNKEGSKVADLGRASDIQTPSATDAMPIPGAIGYAPPEQYYGWRPTNDFTSRFKGDLYHLGSLVFFHFANCSATQALIDKIATTPGLTLTQTDYLQDLPYLQHAFVACLTDLRTSVQPIAKSLTNEVVTIVKQLCEPDPRKRGDPRVGNRLSSQHDLQPYVSRFDRLATRAELKIL
jgi:eukaryotic-like serine/threonine-protein kinase